MRVEPYREIIDCWRAVGALCLRQDDADPEGASESWTWGDRNASNSINDAEQLLCLLFPANELDNFRVSDVDDVSDDIVEAFGLNAVQVVSTILSVTEEFFRRHEVDGTPSFAGGSYFDPMHSPSEPERPRAELDADQRRLPIVDSYSLSITVCLTTLVFIRELRQSKKKTKPKTLKRLEDLESMARRRLTAAMVGLIRSFTVSVLHPDSPQERELLAFLATSLGLETDTVRKSLAKELSGTRSGLRELFAQSSLGEELEQDDVLFECGWSWSLVVDAPPLAGVGSYVDQPDGIAEPLPYLYFTVVALDGIVDLFSERTRTANVLDPAQIQLAQELQKRWDLAQRYWSTIATLGGTRGWAVESIPWRTTDGAESDYFSLLVTSTVIESLGERRASESELSRLTSVLEELASRSRVTRRPLANDPALALHRPGLRIALGGSEASGPQMSWLASDFAPLLLKRTVRAAQLARSADVRDRLLKLADSIWDHVSARRILDGPAAGLWDEPSRVFSPSRKPHREPPVEDAAKGATKPTWYLTERVIEGLVATANAIKAPPLRSPALAQFASELLHEADHLIDQLYLQTSQRTPETLLMLRDARSLLNDRPGTAAALAIQCLDRLHSVARTHSDAATRRIS